MRPLIAFIILSTVKIFSHVFYRGNFNWITEKPSDPWRKAKLMVFMNHTSLFEPLYIQALSFSFLWYLVHHINVPGADVTLNRPIVGRFWKLMLPSIASVSRRKDASWDQYMKTIRPDSVVMIAPEGRMKRPNGLDKFGKPMTVRGGVADIIENIQEGGMILCLSGGLHHVQSPGERFPRFFKKINMNLAYFDIPEYKNQFPESHRERKLKMVQDLQFKLETNCPPEMLNK
jgi:hypothetical protein